MNITTPSGQLTAYGLACGYVQRSQQGNYKVDLYREHNSYHVTLSVNGRKVLHDGFGSTQLSEARAFYRKLIAGVKRKK